LTNYNKSLKDDDALKHQLVMLVRADGLSVASAARTLGLRERTCQAFFNAETQWAFRWWEENEGKVDDYFNGFKKHTTHHELNVEKAKKMWSSLDGGLFVGNKSIRIPYKYLSRNASESDAKVLDYFIKIMEDLQTNTESGVFDSHGKEIPKEFWEDLGVKEVTIPEVYKKDTVGVDNSRVLVISDLHFPYQHKDVFKFLQYLKDKYNPTRIICMGDETDGHALSFHDSDPDLPSAGDELRRALPFVQQLHRMFPVMDILDSNHGSLVYRKAKHHGVPKHYIKSYNDVLGVGEGWKWSFDLTIDLPNGTKCYFHHGKSPDVVKLSQVMGMSAVQGHYHSSFKVDYWANPSGLYFGMQTACLIDRDAYAFAYENCNLKKPIIGTGLIIDSHPILEPLIMDEFGNWIGG